MKFASVALISLLLPVTHAMAGIATYNRWTISEINVCFADSETEYRVQGMEGPKRDWKQKEKELVQKVLEEEYTSSRTGYTFVGFQDCQNTEKPNVVVGVRKGLSPHSIAGVKGVATTGMMGPTITSYEGAQGAVILSPSGVSKTTITHEFGHILGLMHEHLHPNAKAGTGSLCPYYSSDSEFKRNLIYTDFDETSVMNYCYTFGPKGWKSGLSLNDQALILDIFNKRYIDGPGRFSRY